MKTPVLSLAVLLCAAAPAQELTAPESWKWITDEPSVLAPESEGPDAIMYFVEMAPGFHITNASGATLYEPTRRASGRFTLSAHIFVFPDASHSGYGLFVGGRDMESPRAARIEFLLRRDGMASVVHRHDGETKLLLDWTPFPAIAQPSAEDTGANDLAIEAGASAVVFKVNEQVVATVPRAELDVDGHFGFRLGPAMNVHISTLDFTTHLAPVRAGS